MYKDAIQVFRDKLESYNKWYYAQERVPLAVYQEKQELEKKCKFAIDLLKGKTR